jgi:signal transduction histidine kinase/DNA-binding response OmpR family regulator
MIRLFHFASIRNQLVFWFLIAALIPTVGIPTVIYFQRVHAIRAFVFERLQTVRDLKARQIQNWLDERSGDLHVLAADTEIRAAVDTMSPAAPRDPTARDNARQLLREFKSAQQVYSEVFLVDPAAGRVLLSTAETHEGLFLGNDPCVIEPLRTRAFFIAPPAHNRAEGRNELRCSIPVAGLRREPAAVTGILVVRIDMDHSLYPILLDRTGMGETGEMLIVSKDVLALSPLRGRENAPFQVTLTARPAAEAAAGHTGIIEGSDYRDVPVLGAYTFIPTVQWGLVAKQDQSEAYAAIPAMLRQLAVLCLIGALVSLLAAIFIGRGLSRPILRLRDAADRVSKGDLAVRCDLGRRDELDALGRSFDQMAASLSSALGVQSGVAAVSEALVAPRDVAGFGRELLRVLVERTGSQVGALYLRAPGDKPEFHPVASIGLTPDRLAPFDADRREGEFGPVLASGKLAWIKDVPRDTAFVFKAVVGDALPRQILTLPVRAGDNIAAVISIGTLTAYPQDAVDILTRSLPNIGVGLANAVAAEERDSLMARLQKTNEELAALNEELQSQAEELRQQAEELSAQAVELKAQREQVEEATRLKSQFLANMSHELRTPLNSVLALSQLMLSRDPAARRGDQETEYLRVIERNGRQLLNLINDILDLSKIEAGRMELTESDFNPRDAAERAAATIRPLAEQKGLELRLELADAPRIRTDEERLTQVLLNLLSNAVKFTDQGRVTLCMAHLDHTLSFTIADTGIGIPPEHLPRLFDEFRQGDGSVTRRYGGTGLGLAISRRLARLLGGRITVASEPGKGSLFTLTLPLNAPLGGATPALADDAFPAPPPRPAAHDAPFSLLVVEDNDVASLQIRAAAEDCGFLVHSAPGGAEALACLRDLTPDGIVLDLMMPGVDGFEVLRTLRSDPRTAHVPVLVLTAKELTAEDRKQLRFNNVSQLILKGQLDRQDLMRRLCELVGGRIEDGRCRPAPAAPLRIEGRPLVLIVEDDPDNLATLTALLDDIGCRHVSARNGEQALAAARVNRLDLVLMDIHLPGMDGLEITRRLRESPDTCNVPVIAITARALKGDREAILRAGCDDYLTKPLSPAALTTAIGNHLRTGR